MDDVLQVKDVDYTIDYPDGVLTFDPLLSNGTVITATYLYDGQLVFPLAAPVVIGSETIYVDDVAQVRDVDYTIDNHAGVIDVTIKRFQCHRCSRCRIKTGDYIRKNGTGCQVPVIGGKLIHKTERALHPAAVVYAIAYICEHRSLSLGHNKWQISAYIF